MVAKYPLLHDPKGEGRSKGHRSTTTPIPRGAAHRGRRWRPPQHSGAGPTPTPRGRARATRAVSPPLPPTKKGTAVGGKRIGQPRRPTQTLCDEHRAPACKSCKGHRGVRHCCSRHHKGHPRVLGGGQRCLPVQGGGGGLQQQLGTMPFGGPVRAPAPSFGVGCGGPVGPAAAVLPRGGTQEPQRGHRRASEEGT